MKYFSPADIQDFIINSKNTTHLDYKIKNDFFDTCGVPLNEGLKDAIIACLFEKSITSNPSKTIYRKRFLKDTQKSKLRSMLQLSLKTVTKGGLRIIPTNDDLTQIRAKNLKILIAAWKTQLQFQETYDKYVYKFSLGRIHFLLKSLGEKEYNGICLQYAMQKLGFSCESYIFVILAACAAFLIDARGPCDLLPYMLKSADINPPPEAELQKALELFVGNTQKFINMASSKINNSKKCNNDSFFICPLVSLGLGEKVFAPFPRLIPYAAPNILYFGIKKIDNNYSSLFGHIFSDYVGRLLEFCKNNNENIKIISLDEDGLKGTKNGVKADFLVTDNELLLIIESKSALRIKRGVYPNDNNNEEKKMRNDIVSAVNQLKAMYGKIKNNTISLKADYKDFFGLIVVWEWPPMLQSEYQRIIIETCHGLKVDFDWMIVDVQFIEKISCFFKAGLSFKELISSLKERGALETLNFLKTKFSSANLEDNFLFPYYKAALDTIEKMAK